MNAYESMFIVEPQVEEESFEAIVSKFENLVNTNGGEVVKTDRLGKRRLAYEIDDRTEGISVDMYFNATGETVAELERVFKLTEEILRYLIVRKDK